MTEQELFEIEQTNQSRFVYRDQLNQLPVEEWTEAMLVDQVRVDCAPETITRLLAEVRRLKSKLASLDWTERQ